jgi:aldose 1-epimerase
MGDWVMKAKAGSMHEKLRELVTLKAGQARCVVCPDIGGSVTAWTIGSQNMLRRTAERALASSDPLAMSSFPLVPYSNRIGFGRFDYLGQSFTIEPNFAPEPHAIHGIGWKMPWVVSNISETRCVLDLNYFADGRWPWSFSARQVIELSENKLTMTLETVNTADQPVPLAFGHHPYFEKSGAFLTFRARRVLMSGKDMLPTYSETPSGGFDFSKGERVEGHDIDHCYAGWDGDARIVWRDRSLGLIITSDMEAAVVYIPKDGEAFCFEPVPHVNNALNRPDDRPAMPVIEPGDIYRSSIVMKAVAAEDV